MSSISLKADRKLMGCLHGPILSSKIAAYCIVTIDWIFVIPFKVCLHNVSNS